jgi:hypothetical protein
MTDVCRACKAPIVWAKTENGRPMPLDPEPDAGGNITLTRSAGRLVAVVLAPAVVEALRDDGERRLFYRSHFATCPYADEFRRRQ